MSPADGRLQIVPVRTCREQQAHVFRCAIAKLLKLHRTFAERGIIPNPNILDVGSAPRSFYLWQVARAGGCPVRLDIYDGSPTRSAGGRQKRERR
jgi:hypothetical protein